VFVADDEHFIDIARLFAEPIDGETTRSSPAFSIDQRAIDRLEPASHVARHDGLVKGQKQDAARVAGMVEVVARGIAVAVHLRPARVEVEAGGHAVATGRLEADHIGGDSQDIIADDDLTDGRVVGMTGHGYRAAPPFAGYADDGGKSGQ